MQGEIYLNRRLSGGKSGALVYLVDITTESFEGLAILKLDNAPEPALEDEHEAFLHAQAISDAPEFADRHLPRVIHATVKNEQLAILSTVAGRRLENAIPLTECSHERQTAVLKSVSSELLSDWNADYRLDQDVRPPQDLIRSWLGFRLNPEQGGGIHRFVEEVCGLPYAIPTFSCNGHWLPNPLYFAEGRANLPERLDLRSALGHCHGDFHSLNLLVDSSSDNQDSYFLIDLAQYQSRQFLFFDHAYFELALLVNQRGSASASDWSALISNLCRFPNLDEQPPLRTDDIGLIDLVNSLRQGIDAWIETNEVERLAYMENQTLLARVAAGLNFAHKRIAPELKRMGFYYAAVNLKDYLKLNRIDWERGGPEFVLETKQTGVTTGATGTAADAASAIVGSEPRMPMPSQSISQIESEPKSNVAPEAADAEPDEPQSVFSFLYELRRRNVVRVAGLYIVVSWLCMQVVGALQPALNLPEWSASLVAVLLALGFLVVCTITWAFELGEKGLQRTSKASSKETPDKAKIGVDYAVMIGIVVIILMTGRQYVPSEFFEGTSAQQDVASGSGNVAPAGETANRPSIAVLPFTGLGNEGSDFRKGLTIELISVLAQTGMFQMPGINSSFQFEDSAVDPREIGETLHVEYLVEGVVRESGNKIRIEANLIRASDGFLIWSNTYDAGKTDLFETQEEIGLAIGAALATPLKIEARELEAQRTENPEAYEDFLKSLPLLAQRGESLLEAESLLLHAVDLAPDFAAAWAALSLAYERIPNHLDEINGRPIRPNLLYRKSKQAALRAQELAPTQPIVRLAVGNMYLRDLQWEAAETQFRSTVAKDPFYVPVVLPYTALLYSVGKFEEAEQIAARYVYLDPLNDFQIFNNVFINEYVKSGRTNVDGFSDLFFKNGSLRPMILRIFLDYFSLRGDVEAVLPIVEACENCTEALLNEVAELVADTGTLPPEDLYSKYRDHGFFGYGLAYSVGGADMALRLFEYDAEDVGSRQKLFTVPWNIIAEVGSDPEFVRIAEEIGLMKYWKLMGWPEDCKPTDDGRFVCT